MSRRLFRPVVLRRVLAVVLLAAGLGAPTPLLAQPSGETRYTMMFRGVGLENALTRVAETTRINLVYDSDIVKGHRVYCSVENASPDALLRCLLADVPVDYVQTSRGTYVLTTSPRRPPRRGDLAGIVVDSQTGEPLQHAHVILAAANTGAASNGAGRFQLPGLTSGTYRVVATHLGYEPSVDSVHVPPGGRIEHRIALKPSPIASGPVIVERVQRHSPVGDLGSGSLSAEDLAAMGRNGTADALGRAGTLMGVHQQIPRADLHVQGGGAGEHRVVLDGMPIRNPVTLRRLLGAFSPLALERLTVHKAGFGVEHGSTVSGVVSAEHATSSGEPEYGTVAVDPLSVNAEGHGSVDLGRDRTAQVRVAARSSVWDVYKDPTLHDLLLDWNVADPLLLASYFDLGNLPDFQPAAQTTGVGFSDIHAATRVDLGPYTSLAVSGYRGRNHLESQFVSRNPTRMLTQDRYDWANTAGQARLDWTLGARTSASAQLRVSEHRVERGYEMTYGEPDPADDIGGVIDSLQQMLDPTIWPDDRNRIREWTLEATASYAATTRHHLKGAIGVSRISSQFRLGGRFLRPTSFDDTRWQIGGYVRDAVSLGMRTEMTAGTRLTYIPARRTLYLEPRVQLHHEGDLPAIGPYAARLAGGVYRQYVNRFDASSTSPTATLPSMRFWLPIGPGDAPPLAYHAALSGRAQPHDNWTVSGEVYYKHYAQLLALDYTEFQNYAEDVVSPGSAVTGTEGYALGTGLALSRSGRFGETTLRYDWSRSRRRFPARFDGRLVPVPWNDPHKLSLSAEVPVVDALRLRLRSEHAWGRTWGYRQTYYDYFGVKYDVDANHEYFGLQDDVDSQLRRLLKNPGGHRLPPRTRVDLGVQYDMEWNGLAVEARFDVINVFDTQNPFDWGIRPRDEGIAKTPRYLPGRRFVGGVTFKY